MVSSVSSSNLLTMSQITQKYFGSSSSTSNIDPETTYADLTQALGSDTEGITKDELQDFLQELEDQGGVDKRALNYLSNLINKFDKISGGDEYISKDDFKTGVQNCLINQGLLVCNQNSKESYDSQIIAAFMNQDDSSSDPLLKALNSSSKSITLEDSSSYFPVDLQA